MKRVVVEVTFWLFVLVACAAADDKCSFHAGVDGHTVGCSGSAP